MSDLGMAAVAVKNVELRTDWENFEEKAMK